MDVNVGDTVLVRGEVIKVDPYAAPYLVRFKDRGAVWVYGSHIASVEPRPLKVGDTVTWGTDENNYTVLAVVDNRAWLRGPYGLETIMSVGCVRRVD